MDVIQHFEEIEIPKEVSFIISDFAYGWKKCPKCKAVYDDTYFRAKKKPTKNCWPCRQKKKASLRDRWICLLLRHYGTIDRVTEIGFTPMYNFADVALKQCDHLDHVMFKYVQLLSNFITVVGIPPLVLERLIYKG